MKKLQIIVTTMYQDDFSINDRMNIVSDVIIANQADKNVFKSNSIQDGIALMVTTSTRGLSRNRNIGIEFINPDTEYIMFADDDLVFRKDYQTLIENEFRVHPEADVIKFNLSNISKVRALSMPPIEAFKKATRSNVSASGVCGLVIKKKCLVKYSLRFNELFGSGTINYCGEDTIFLQEIINKKINFYLSPVVIAGIDQTESTWFEGYNERYFRTIGMVLAAIFPKLSFLIALRSAYRFSKRRTCSLNFLQIYKHYIGGIWDYKHL